jgi:hypothetical protein
MYPERRRHRRILTLKNFAKALVLLVVFLAGLSVEVSLRDSSGDYGRLMQKDMPRNNDIRPQPPVVTEAPVADQTAADPMLLAPAAREQEFLSTGTTTTTTTTATTTTATTPPLPSITIRRASESSKPPVLAGGIFKQQQ